jgi:opacity protein-like surface antigen
LVDKLAEHDEPVTVFCAHDAIVTFGSPQAASFNTTKSGGTVGGGVEKRLWGGWTAKAEYLYVNLGSFNHVIQTPTTAAGTFATFSSTTVFRITSSALG